MTYTAGIDVGSNYTKAVILSDEQKVLGAAVRKTGFDFSGAAERALDDALALAGLAREQLQYVASTGFGRYLVPFRDIHITELTCHARGAVFLFPATRTVLDVGAQGIKAIKVDERGKVRSFRLNDKCAAGSGAFLEKTARYMGFTMEEIGELAIKSRNPVTVSSVCTVFAESEVINHLTEGRLPEDILYGAMLSLAGRSAQLMKRVGMVPEFTLTGSMSLNSGFVRALTELLQAQVNVPADGLGRLSGALGASLLAMRRVQKLRLSSLGS